jgi:hypothetical protein
VTNEFEILGACLCSITAKEATAKKKKHAATPIEK